MRKENKSESCFFDSEEIGGKIGMKKFELTAEYVTNIFGKKLFRIKALVAFGDVKEGDLGGFVEKESNLDNDGNAWVYGNAKVSGDARVYGDAQVSGDARVCGNALVCGNAQVSGNARVSGEAWVYDNARVCGNARVSGDARVCGNLDYAIVGGFGSEQRTTTFFRQKDGTVGVRCGCFYGTLEEFRGKVKKTHKDSKYGQEYLMIADLMELHFAGGKEDDER